MLGDDCEDLARYLRGHLCPQVERRFKLHLGGCNRCQLDLMRQALREHAARPTLADRAQEAVTVGLGLVQLGRELAGEALELAGQLAKVGGAAALIVFFSAAWEWWRWQSGPASARWSVRSTMGGR